MLHKTDQKMWTLLITLMLFFGHSDALTCYCSECPEQQCTGDMCTAKVAFNINNGQVEHWWSCSLPSQTHSCNTSSHIITTLCCASGDYCNQPLTATLGATEGTIHLPTNTPISTTHPTAPIVPILMPETPGGMTNQPQTPQTTATPTSPETTSETRANTDTPPTSTGSCFKSDSSKSDLVTLCTLTTTCFSLLRKKSDGTIVSKRGCSKGPCQNETRNRKVKRCCKSSLCNTELSPDDFFTDLQATTEPLSTQHTASTSPTDPETSTDTTDPTDTTVATTTQIRPIIRPPILTPLTSTTGTPPTTEQERIYCHCDNTEQGCTNNFCSTSRSCLTTYVFDSSDIQIDTIKSCMTELSVCEVKIPREDGTSHVSLCCDHDHLCNGPPLTRPTEEQTPTSVLYTTPEPTDGHMTSTEDHMTSSDPVTTEDPINTDLIVDYTTRPPTPPPTTSSSPSTTAKPTQDPAELQNLYYTIGTIVCVVIAVLVIAILIATLAVGCLRYRRTNHKAELVQTMTLQCPPSSCHGDKYGSSGEVVTGRASSQSCSPSVKSVSTHSVTSV